MSDIRVGDVVQIDPAHDDTFGGHFLTVTELKSWGVMGYCKPLVAGVSGLAYYRVPFEKIVRVGKAEWSIPLELEPACPCESGLPIYREGMCAECYDQALLCEESDRQHGPQI
jgi:hypothetical protein